jgi:dipeptidyl-peptidase-4
MFGEGTKRLLCSICAAGLLWWSGAARAQDRLPSLPNYERYARLRETVFGASRLASLRVAWVDNGKAFEYEREGKAYRYTVATGQESVIPRLTNRPEPRGRRAFRGGGFVERGRQYTSAESPDGKRKAFYKDQNLWISNADDTNAIQITMDGDKTRRIKNGTASWVYGEELDQNSAMWWSPDSRKLAYYRFDESQVPDYYLAMGVLRVQNTLDVEPYPKAGAPNPIVDLYVYDLERKQAVRIDVRDGKPFTNEVVGHYVYQIQWSPDGKELLFHRTNRLQNVMEIVAANPMTGRCRVIVRETWPASWTDNKPAMQYLSDNYRFILRSERNGWYNYYLHDLSGQYLHPITRNTFEAEDIVRVDEQTGFLYYMARSGDNPYKFQLHRARLDGTEDRRLTDPTLHHDIQLAPDGKHFIDTAQTHDKPPVVRLVNAEGSVLKTLAESDTQKLDSLNIPRAELFTCKAADGVTDLYGMLYKPSHFDPNKRYPLLISVYAGPESDMVSERFAQPNPTAELGFLVAYIDGRGTLGRGKKFKDAVYGKLGIVEIDDQAAGVKYLRQRAYVDGGRVGIHGVSYGGYAAAMCLLRHPGVFHAACASSSVTDWRNYDSIYTERYMGLPEANDAGYDAGSAMRYAGNLKGRLLLYYGTADNNVHPANTYQLIAALQRAGKNFEVQVGPDLGHTSVNPARMLEFFMEALVLRPISGQKLPEPAP